MALNEEEQNPKVKKNSQFSVKKKYSADSLKFEQDSQKTVSAKDANIIDKSNIVSKFIQKFKFYFIVKSLFSTKNIK